MCCYRFNVAIASSRCVLGVREKLVQQPGWESFSFYIATAQPRRGQKQALVHTAHTAALSHAWLSLGGGLRTDQCDARLVVSTVACAYLWTRQKCA
jgi:hypothetical protein